MKFSNDPTSCNDLIITLIACAVIISLSFAWLYHRGENALDDNVSLISQISSLQSNKKELETHIESLTLNNQSLIAKNKQQQNKLNELQSNFNNITDQLSSVTTEIKQLNIEYSTKEKQLKNTIDELIVQISNTTNEKEHIQKINTSVASELDQSKQQLQETRQLSIQQFEEFKQLKRDFIQTKFEADRRLKEINDWQLEVEKLKKQLADTKIKINPSKKRFTVFELNQDILFNKGQSQLKSEGKKTLATLANALQQYPSRQIAIQGHSDKLPLGPKLKVKYNSNWELASARAASAIHYLQFAKNINPKRLLLVSYGHHRPKSEGETAKDFALNRRIEITLMPKDFDFLSESTH